MTAYDAWVSDAPELVDWALAERVARRVAKRNAPPIDPRSRRRLVDDFAELTPVAEALVEASTGLRSSAGPARADVTDRGGWVHENIGSFRRLLRPILQRATSEDGFGRNMPPVLASAARLASGTELGVVLGWMSTRVLGQYDLFRAEEGEAPSDAVYYVGPNVIALERRHGFNPQEFRLWIAVHELTHRAQFTGVSWMRQYFLDLVDKGLTIASPDAKQLMAAIARMASDIRARRNPLADSGIIGALAPPEQLATLHQIQALMSLLEGHGDVTMNRAAADRIPGAQRFATTLQARRDSARGTTRLVQQLIGLEAKMKQYQEGEKFVEAVEIAGGPELFARVWEAPEHLPTLEEVRDPARWVSRLGGRRLELA
jgi:coenzyme F420 biosynthesis associated uncharacterized protein